MNHKILTINIKIKLGYVMPLKIFRFKLISAFMTFKGATSCDMRN